MKANTMRSGDPSLPPTLKNPLPPEPSGAPHSPPAPPSRKETDTPQTSSSSIADNFGRVEIQTWDDGDYMAVISSHNLLKLDPDLNIEATSGYINSNPQATTAKINKEF